jgi:hypothetical protein
VRCRLPADGDKGGSFSGVGGGGKRRERERVTFLAAVGGRRIYSSEREGVALKQERRFAVLSLTLNQNAV